MPIEGININVEQFIGIVIGITATVISPLIAYTIKQKSKLEKLETLREGDRKDFDEHMKHSELQGELLNKISETVSVYKYMLERIEDDIKDIKRDYRIRNSNNTDYNKSAV